MNFDTLTECKRLTHTILSRLEGDLPIDLSRFEERNQELITDAVNALVKSSPDEIQARVAAEFLGHGPLSKLIEDESVTEVLVNGMEEIWFEQKGLLQKLPDTFLSRDTFRNFFERLFAETKSEVTVNVPFTDTSWLGHRVHLAAPPVSRDFTLSLRKKSSSLWTLPRLLELEWANDNDIAILRDIVKAKKSMLIVGGTSSGKTSVLDACLREIKETERAVLVEDTQELKIPNKVSTSLLSRTDPKGLVQTITLHDLVKQSLRMRPDRIVMGEVRGSEAKDLLMAFATGHEGSMGTLHANTAQEALLRLEMLIQLGAPQWSLSAIRRLIYLSLSYIVVVKRDSNGKRKLESINRISSVEDFGFLTEKIST